MNIYIVYEYQVIDLLESILFLIFDLKFIGIFKLNVGQLLYMKPKNKKLTEIYCVEDLFKFSLFGEGDLLYICNIISPKIVDLFSEIMDIELFAIYFDYREYGGIFARTHVRNGLVRFKLNKKYIIYKQTYEYR